MFETSRPQQNWQGRLLFIEMLPVSIALHALIVAGIIFATVWKVSFPSDSPKMYAAFQLAETPPPPPPPPPPPAARPRVVQTQPVQTPTEIVAPTVIPEEIPVVTNEPPPPTVDTGVVGGVEGGVEGGEVGGVVGGEIGGVVTDTAPPPPPPPADGRLYVERDEPLPLEPVKQDYPVYPYTAVKAGIEDRVIVRYVIGKDGRVKSVTILDKPMHEMFVKPTVEAIKAWRFRPMVVDGQRTEVVHELTVNYRLNRARGG